MLAPVEDRNRACVNDVRDADSAGGLEDVHGPHDVDQCTKCGVGPAEGDLKGAEMDDPVHVVGDECLLKIDQVCDISLDESDPLELFLGGDLPYPSRIG
jgi:hypothetical protein